MSDRHQEIMDEAYDRWQAHNKIGRKVIEDHGQDWYNEHRNSTAKFLLWSMEDFWAQLSPREMVAVFTGNLNQQVQNGGWLQWHDNGYSDCANWLIGQLPKFGEVSKQVAQMVVEVMKEIEAWPEEVEEWVEDCWEEELENGVIIGHGESYWEMVPNEEPPEVDQYDEPYWDIGDAFLAEVEVILNLSDVDLQGLLDAEVKPVVSEKKPILRGPLDGNIFFILGAANGVLKDAGQKDKATEMGERATSAGSYDEALSIVTEYVDIRL
jgi:hypothetical protein